MSERCLQINGNLEIIIQFVYVRLYYSPETVYCLLLSRMARMEMAYNLKKLANYFKFALWTDRVFGPKSTLDLSVKSYHRSSSRVQRNMLTTSKGNRELYLWSFDEKTANVRWHSPFTQQRPQRQRKRHLKINISCQADSQPCSHPISCSPSDGQWVGRLVKQISHKLSLYIYASISVSQDKNAELQIKEKNGFSTLNFTNCLPSIWHLSTVLWSAWCFFCDLQRSEPVERRNGKGNRICCHFAGKNLPIVVNYVCKIRL